MNTKEKILAAALELFAKDGFEAVSVSMIADKLGLTKGALYKHYSSKRDIFDCIVERMQEKDYENAKQFDMPEDVFDNIPETHKNTAADKLCGYTLAQFLYWTEDEFAANFRKMLRLERYRDKDMDNLFQQYLGLGPVQYLEDILREIFSGSEDVSSFHLLALEYYAPVYMLIDVYDSHSVKADLAAELKNHIESFLFKLSGGEMRTHKMNYTRSEKYSSPEMMAMIMGPNPIKIEEELLENNKIKPEGIVCDLGSGNGLTSVFLQQEYNFTVYAADLWSDPGENRKFFDSLGLDRKKIVPVKADALALPFEKDFFDAVVSIDSYNYFGRDESYLGDKLLPFVKPGGYIYIAIPGMKKDCHDNLPPELLLSWSPEQMDFMHDTDYWRRIISQTKGIEIQKIQEMESNEEVWEDWLKQENPYSIGDRKSMEAGAGKYLNFISIVLKKL